MRDMLQTKSSEKGKNVSTKNKFGTLRNEITVVQAKKECSKKDEVRDMKGSDYTVPCSLRFCSKCKRGHQQNVSSK